MQKENIEKIFKEEKRRVKELTALGEQCELPRPKVRGFCRPIQIGT
jgi:hypothetical protein